jgi:hypothetical protein
MERRIALGSPTGHAGRRAATPPVSLVCRPNSFRSADRTAWVPPADQNRPAGGARRSDRAVRFASDKGTRWLTATQPTSSRRW